MQEKLLSVHEVSEALGVSECTVYRLANQRGGIKAIKVGRSLRFRPADLEAYLKRREVKPPEKAEHPFPGMVRFQYKPGMRVV